MANPNKRSSFTKALHYVSLDHIPGPRGLKYLRYVKHFQNNILGAFTQVNREYKDIASFPWPMNSIIIYSPEFAKSVLVDNNKNYIKGEQIEELRAIVGNGLATNNNHESWLKSRALLAREFNNKSVGTFIEQFDSMSKAKFNLWQNRSTPIDICEEMKFLTFEIACATLLGVNLSTEDAIKVNKAVHFTSVVTYERIFKIFPVPYWVPTPANFKFNKCFNDLNEIVFRLINQERKNKTPAGLSVLEKLVHAKDPETNFAFSDDELRDEILTMMLAGHETSAHTLTWIFGLLAKHSEIQEKLYKDIQANTSIESIAYLKLVMNEAMRLYPAFPVLSRKTAVDCQLGDYKIPKNTNVVIPIYVMQRHANNWENPSEFIPERFSDPAAEKSYAFLPFSRGPRRCIAELFAMTEMSIIVVNLLKLYKIELTTDNLPEEVAFVSLKPVDGMKIKLTKR